MTDWAQAIAALEKGSPRGRGTTSDLTIDETLLLHSTGWEPVDMVFGVSWWSVPWGTWQYQLGAQAQLGEVPSATQAFAGAFAEASHRMEEECARAGGAGVVGVEIDLKVNARHIDVALAGTAIRHPGQKGKGRPFLSDLSARDFALLGRAGWRPVGLTTGASFVIAPRRSVGQWLSQQNQNAELPNLTQALYQAREGAMSRMQSAAQSLGADGIVNVRLREGPLGYGFHVVQFVAMGTAVVVDDEGHRNLSPTMVVPLDDLVRQFEATTLGSTTPG